VIPEAVGWLCQYCIYSLFLVPRLPNSVTRAYLSRRIFIATSAFAVSVLLIVAAGVQAISSFQTYSRFSGLFVQLFEVTMRLETELGWSLAQKATPERLASLASRYRDALSVFAALRASDGSHHASSEGRWAVLETEYGISPEEERTRFDLHEGSMPRELRRLWHEQDVAGASLETIVADFFASTQAIIENHASDYSAAQLRSLEFQRNLNQTRLFPAFHNAAEVIGRSTAESAAFAFWLLIACAGAGMLATVFSAAFILRPMQRKILANQELLVRERDRAQASEWANRDFLAMMSHELRTPMNGVIGFTDLLLATPLTPQQKEHASTIKESAQNLLGLLNSILELSKIEAGPLTLVEEDFSLAEVIEDVATLLAPQAYAKRLDLGAYIDPALPEKLRGDEGRIRQVLINLVGNAIKFTGSGGVAIELRHESESTEGHTVLVAVTDTGMGIARDQLDRIFERFTQVDNSSSRRFEGSGLGLSISRQLVRMMGGEIGVESMPDKGSTFWVRFTLKGVTPPAVTLSERANVSFAGKRFLVVDDNPLNRRIFRLQLESYGAEVECVPDAQSAIAALTRPEAHCDIAIIDQMMPGTDGIALRRMIREEPNLAALKLIISSSGGIGYDQQARALGFDAACPKPVMQDKLIGKIQDLLAPVPGEGAGLSGDTVAVLPPKPAVQPAPAVKSRQPRLLIAEDNPINQRLIATALKQARFVIDLVSDGVEAVQAVQREHYDLVLMDIRMPVMSGVEATQKIRALPGLAAKLPIIAMTANAMVGDREEYLSAGMDDYVAKPIDFNILLAKIRSHLPLGIAETTAATAEPAPWAATEKKRL
jgi:signal transduction histidine kinase/CheY-like chemotaxis protein